MVIESGLVFAVEGPPVTWKRVNVVGGRGVVDARSRAYKRTVGALALRARQSLREWSLDKSHRYHVGIVVTEKDGRRGDLDNHGKAVLDACNGILWEDDRQIDLLTVERATPSATQPRTVVRVIRLVKP